MGVSVKEIDYKDPVKRKEFVKHLMDDIDTLQSIHDQNLFDTEKTRMGLEQEFNVIDYDLNPLMCNLGLLDRLKDNHYTTELAKFNLEINLDPRVYSNRCLSQFENDLIRLLTKANKHAHKMGGKVILTGILPTISREDIDINNITPLQRYLALNEAMSKMRGKEFEFNIQGIDELITTSDSVLFESCNTSFQVHIQIDPYQFKEMYNWAQIISGPVLSCSVNSPIFLGKRLWKETRIALFHQSTDVRKMNSTIREERPRVLFGVDWEEGSIVDHYRENISRFKILLTRDIEERSSEVLKSGKTPKLEALSMHNGTIYKWNRACYGITNQKPHIRIEARYLPAGPTIHDEMASAAFWTGLMHGMPDEYKNAPEVFDFENVKSNFIKAARVGFSAQFKWRNSQLIPAKDLITKELLPIAEEGLKKAKINSGDIDKYLGTIKERIKKSQTGSSWMIDSVTKLRKERTKEEAIMAITEGIYQRQKAGIPIHKWKLAEFQEKGSWTKNRWEIRQVMSTDLITVQEDDLIDLVRNIMLWSNIRHVPVENEEGALQGMISAENLLAFYGGEKGGLGDASAGDVMESDIVSVSPKTLAIDAVRVMRQNETSCLPVIESGKLVGLFTEKDYLKFSEHLFDELASDKKSNKKSK